MRVCFICSEYPPSPHGGIGSVTQVLGRGLVARGHEVKVVGVYEQADAPLSQYWDEGVEVWRLRRPAARLGWIGARYLVFRQVAAWAREGLIDLVECPDWEGWAAGWPKLNVPVLARLHGSQAYFAAELRQRCRKTAFWLERASLRRSDFWCSVSRYTSCRTSELFAPPGEGCAVIYNAVDTEEVREPVARRNGDVVFSGTLTEKKGIRPLMQAWPMVKARHPEAVLHVYGKDSTRTSGPSMRQSLESELPEAARSSVIFHGHQPRTALLEHLRRAHVAVFPSYAEAFAMAPLEAMGQGCPTIYSRLGSGPELIDDGRDGLLVDPARTDEIAAAIGRVLSNASLAAELGRAGEQKVKARFSTRIVLGRNEEFYAECVERFRLQSAN